LGHDQGACKADRWHRCQEAGESTSTFWKLRSAEGGESVIITLTVNPSLDRTVEIDTLVHGAVHRARAVHVDPGGKGVNVARVLSQNGYKSRAVLPAGPAADLLLALLTEAGIEYVRTPIAGAVRSNTAVTEPDGTVTKFNEPGPRMSDEEVDALVAATVEAAQGATWVVLSGSLAPGLPDDFYASVVRRLEGTGARVAVDTSGPALGAVLDAGPAVVKPNREELVEVTGRTISTIGDVVDAAQDVRRRGPATVLASLGRDGAVLVTEDLVVYAEPPPIAPVSTVGAGDSMLAGFLAAGGADAEALREALAWGSAAASLPGSTLPRPADLHRTSVTIHPEVARERLLSEKD
jgi:1-phosphofructokinase